MEVTRGSHLARGSPVAHPCFKGRSFTKIKAVNLKSKESKNNPPVLRVSGYVKDAELGHLHFAAVVRHDEAEQDECGYADD